MPRLTSPGTWARTLTMIVSALILALLGAAMSARADSGQPKVIVTPACHDGIDPYAFEASLTGFPPNQPFDAVLHYSGSDHDYAGVVQTDSNGNFAPTRFGDTSPLGVVTATVTTTINGTEQTFTASLDDPCVPPLSLSDAMCGDGGYGTYYFHAFADCAAYVGHLQDGTVRPSIALSSTCAANSYGFTGLALGFPPGTALQAYLSYGGQQLDVGTAANRFGAVGPVGFTSERPLGLVSATVTGDGVSLTATLQDPCTTGRRFARAISDKPIVAPKPKPKPKPKRHHKDRRGHGHKRHHHLKRPHQEHEDVV